MTPEARAAAMLNRAAEQNLLDGYERIRTARWHSLVSEAITAALKEARDLCGYVPDRIRIGELMVGHDESAPGIIDCLVCDGTGRIGSVECRACNGIGRMGDSGPMPDPAPGTMASKPCGCAVDWFGDGAPAEYQGDRRRLWAEQGWSSRPATAGEALPLITRGAGGCDKCRDRRAAPRDPIGAPDVVSP